MVLMGLIWFNGVQMGFVMINGIKNLRVKDNQPD
jgi:hypothetical protein